MPEAPKDERTPELDASAERTPLEEKNAGHWQLFGDLLAFQLKLVLDATRDLFLSPISIIAAVVGFLSRSENPGRYFYQLLELGHRLDSLDLLKEASHAFGSQLLFGELLDCQR